MGGGLFIKRSWRQFDIVVITISGKFFVIPSLSRFKNVRDDNTKKKKNKIREKNVFFFTISTTWIDKLFPVDQRVDMCHGVGSTGKYRGHPEQYV